MSILHLVLRFIFAFIWIVSIFGFITEGNSVGAVFAFLPAMIYLLPLLYWLGIKKMPVSTVPPWDRTLTNEGALKFCRWTFAAIYSIISLSIFVTGKNDAAIPYTLMSLTLTLPLDRLFFAPVGSLPDIKPLWLNAWVIVFRNFGILLCGFNAGLENDKPSLTTITLAWIGLGLITIHPLILCFTGKFRLLWQVLLRPSEPTPARNPRPRRAQTSPGYSSTQSSGAGPNAPAPHRITAWAKPPRLRPKPKYHGANAWQWNWPLPPGATRYPLDETAFFQLMTGFQASWLEAKDYHTRLAVHRNPAEFKRQLLKEVTDSIKAIRMRPAMLIRRGVLSGDFNVGSVPDEISKLWLSDRRIRSLYKATQIFCATPTKKVVMPFRSVLPHVAEYRAMINLVKWLEHSLKKNNPSPAVTTPTPSAAKAQAPSLSDERYFEIIDYIIKLGKDFENYTDLNENFDEQRYRNYFLPFLNSVSPDYAAKGEVFHRKGKTDILVWDKTGTNLFIAECKIWRGEAYLLQGLEQLLDRYVNWRDEKTALIVFNRDVQDFSSVIRTATAALSNHALCHEPGRPRRDCSWSYLFHHAGDPARTIRLELILLNFV